MTSKAHVLALLLAACTPGSGEKPGDGPSAADDDVTSVTGPTWHRDVQPLLAERCGACHRDGGLAPFATDDLATVKAWGPAIVDAVRAGTMPPFDADESACDDHVPFRDDPRLSAAEKDLLAAWVDAGAPEGDAASAPDAPDAAADTIAEPDAVVTLPTPYTVDGTEDRYVCFRVPVDLAEDVYLKGVEVRPDNDLVVHHVLVWSDPHDQSADRADADGKYDCSGTPDFFPTQLVGTWTPGAGVMRTPEGTGTPLKKGGSLVVNIHYHPTGEGPEVDRSSVALAWTTERPAQFATWFLVDLPFGSEPIADETDGNTEFRIPAGASAHVERHQLDTSLYSAYLFFDLPIFAVTPHMHFLGTDMLVTLHHQGRGEATGDDECMIHTPTYRFDWQTTYVYDAPVSELPTLSPGDRLEVRCTYDNSPSNPYLQRQMKAAGIDAPGDVWWGEQTKDEMCMAMVGFVMPPIDLDDIFDQIGL